MGQRFLAPIAFTLAGVFAFVATPGAQGKWWERYKKGLDAYRSHDWMTAITELEVASALEEKQGANKRTEGVYTVDYYPYFYLCVSYLKANNLPRAEENCKKARNNSFGKLSNQLGVELKGFEADLVKAKTAPPPITGAPTTPPASKPAAGDPPEPPPAGRIAAPPPAIPPASTTGNSGGSSAGTSSRGAVGPEAPKKPAPAPTPPPRTPPTRDALIAYLEGDVNRTITLLEPAVKDRGYDAGALADMHAYLGVAYANRSLIAATPDERTRLGALAAAEFRSVLTARPNYQLSPRIVSPRIIDLFDEEKRKGGG